MFKNFITQALNVAEKLPTSSPNFINFFLLITTILSTTAAYYSIRKITKTHTQEKRNRVIDCCEPLTNNTATNYEKIKIDISFYDYSQKTIDLECLKKVLRSNLPHKNLNHLSNAGHLFKKENNKLIINKKKRKKEKTKAIILSTAFLFGLFVWTIPLNILPLTMNQLIGDYSKLSLAITYISSVIACTIFYLLILATTLPAIERFKSIKQLESL